MKQGTWQRPAYRPDATNCCACAKDALTVLGALAQAVTFWVAAIASKRR